MKRIICLTLCGIVLAGTLIACKPVDQSENPDESNSDVIETDAPDMSGVCEVPDTDEWKGREFRVWQNEYSKTDIHSEGINGDVINDAVFKRNMMVEAKYGVKVVLVGGTDMLSVVAGGQDAFDLFGHKYSGMNSAIVNGVCLDISKLTYMSPEKSWWNTELIDSFEIGGKRLVFSGDFSQRIMDYTWTIIVNKDMADEYHLKDSIYQTVKDGEWTIEKLKQNCKNVTTDSHADGVLDHNDTWGFLSSKNVATALMTSSDIKTVVHDSNGNLKYNLNTPNNIVKLQNIWEFSVDNTFQLKAQSITGVDNIYTEVVNIFNSGRALYQARVIKDIITSIGKINCDYALIPLPKYNEDQDDYISTFQAHSSGTYIVPRTISDPDFVSAILEYMCYCSTDTVRAAYYDNVLQGRATEDAESREMLDLIFASSTTDLGLHLGVSGMRDFVDKILNSETNIISSEVSGRADKVATELFKYENSVKIWG